mmetsp:Transcript_8942/g.24789  ORF Transcript_8942/g.24789 Transcript_8942/m.24789 type:complete len:129 (-) Transcript_8942:106-492(-)
MSGPSPPCPSPTTGLPDTPPLSLLQAFSASRPSMTFADLNTSSSAHLTQRSLAEILDDAIAMSVSDNDESEREAVADVDLLADPDTPSQESTEQALNVGRLQSPRRVSSVSGRRRVKSLPSVRAPPKQ